MKIILFVCGLAVLIFSHPLVSRFILSRLYNEGWVTPQNPPLEKTIIVQHTGPRVTLILIGVVLMLASIFVK